MILAFISTSYARSDNCKMEFQYAVKSLRKPVIPIIVGDGDEWRETVIGCLVAGKVVYYDPSIQVFGTISSF